MKVPNTFQLAGTVWTVEKCDLLEALGICMPDDSKILIRRSATKQQQEATFCHELVHAIQFTMGRHEQDEVFTEGFAQLLHQFLLQRAT